LYHVPIIQEAIAPTNLCNAQRRQHNVNGAKMLFFFHQHFSKNITAYFKQQFWHQMPYFGAFWQNAVAIKSIEKYLRKSCSALAPKILVKLTPGQPMLKYSTKS
jgi:hypothetical protein